MQIRNYHRRGGGHTLRSLRTSRWGAADISGWPEEETANTFGRRSQPFVEITSELSEMLKSWSPVNVVTLYPF